MNYYSQQKISWTRLLLILIFFIYLTSWISGYHLRKNIIQYDVARYYGYLPAVFHYQDLTFSFLEEIPESSLRYIDISLNRSPDGKHVMNKMTMGLSFLYLPMYAIANLYAEITNNTSHQFSNYYGGFILFGGMLYGIAGLIVLSRILKKYFSDFTTALTIFILAFGTNFFNYCVAEGGMSHVYSFFLFSLFLLVTLEFYSKPAFLRAFIAGLLLGLITLIRPTNIIVIVPFLLWEVKGLKDLKNRFYFFRKNFHYLVLMVFSVFLVFIPQFLYWKFITGSYLYYSYQNEGFNFLNPQIINGLFSFKKGWLIYTPAMFFALVGFFFMLKKEYCRFFIPVLSFFIINIYVIFSWKMWWYGGSYSARTLVESYVFLALPLSVFIDEIRKRKVFKLSFIAIILLFFMLNIFQTYQYAIGILHRDRMTSKAYWYVFGKFNKDSKIDEFLESKPQKRNLLKDKNKNKK